MQLFRTNELTNYIKARKEFAAILDKDYKRKDTWIAAIKNELWGDMPYIALEMSNKGLDIFICSAHPSRSVSPGR